LPFGGTIARKGLGRMAVEQEACIGCPIRFHRPGASCFGI
jgi:hypothetical protein